MRGSFFVAAVALELARWLRTMPETEIAQPARVEWREGPGILSQIRQDNLTCIASRCFIWWRRRKDCHPVRRKDPSRIDRKGITAMCSLALRTDACAPRSAVGSPAQSARGPPNRVSATCSR